jgi:hypothetical protein
VAVAPAGTDCGSTAGATCATFASGTSVTLTANPDAGLTFAGWDLDVNGDPGTPGDCTGTSATCTVIMSANRSVRPVFDVAIPPLTDFTPQGIRTYLMANTQVNTPARFIRALPSEFRQNWILMSRSESLQTGTAASPRILMPSADARFVFSVGMTTSSSYPGAHPNAIELMQFDSTEKNFRFHEIVLDSIPAMGAVPPRMRGVSADDEKCSRCHSTRNVIDLDRSVTPPVPGSTPGTDGIPPGSVKVKNKPNWDSYDSWGGMVPFNRDRIYQGSAEAAMFRKVFDPWTWSTSPSVRAILEQLQIQPPGVDAVERVTRLRGGTNDGVIKFAFDGASPPAVEPVPTSSGTGLEAPINTAYSFDVAAGAATSVTRGGTFVTLHHSGTPGGNGLGVEGRGVQLFDLLGGADGELVGIVRKSFNAQRVLDELVTHRTATGNAPIDVRPIALAIVRRCFTIDTASNSVKRASTTSPVLGNLAFFDARAGMTINELVTDTEGRADILPRRKADIEKRNLDRTGDPYVRSTSPLDGLIPQYGAFTSAGTSTALARLRQEVFRRPVDLGAPDATTMGGIYVDRELHAVNTNKLALYRYFLEPLGVSVDKWSMGVRGRSRTYTFADVFGDYENVLDPDLEASLVAEPFPGLSAYDCASLIGAINTTILPALPAATAIPTYTDVQRIFNKSCIECHGGLDYPPYVNYGSFLNLSEEEAPTVGDRLDRSYGLVTSAYTTTDPRTSFLYQRICPGAGSLPTTDSPCAVVVPALDNESCPFGLMPCGGPRLSHTDIATIRRWIVGGRANTRGDPHLKTVDGVDYDFQASGEFVLLRGEGLEVQARQTPVSTNGPLSNAYTGLTSCVSLNTAVATRVGKHRITYEPNLNGQPDPRGMQLRVDGKLMDITAAGIALASGGRIIPTNAQGGIQIQAPGGTVVSITPNFWDYYQVWYLDIDVAHARATQGMMGLIAPGGWLPALPDGGSVGPRPRDLPARYKQLYGTLGNAWRVTDKTSLFDYAPGTSTRTFTVARWPNGESPESCVAPPLFVDHPAKPPLRALPVAVAEEHCRQVVAKDAKANCVQDVSATGEPSLARAYVAAERVQGNRVAPAPVLGVPENFKTDVVLPVSFTWRTTTDPDGDPLTYRHCVWEVRKLHTFQDCTLVPDPIGPWKGSVRCAGLVALIGFVLLVLVILLGGRKRPIPLLLAFLLVMAAVALAYYLCRTHIVPSTMKATAGLESGKAYYWKVIAEDAQGGTVESETRRFDVK